MAIEGLLLVVLFVIVVFSGVKVIKKEEYRIGVYKSLGYGNKQISLSFVWYMILVVVSIFIVSTLMSLALSFIANAIMKNAFAFYMKTAIYNYIDLIKFRFVHVLYFNAFVFAFTSMSIFITIISIRKIKPNNIIRRAD